MKNQLRVLFFLVAALGAGLALSPAGCGGGGDDGCKVGSEGCTCTGGGSCDPGLSCLSSRCVKAGSPGTGGAPGGQGGTPGGGTGGAPMTGNLMQFTGTWQYLSGTGTANCGAGSQTEQLMGTFKVMTGIDSALVIIDGTCTLKMDVSGNVATLRSGQTCMSVAMGNSATLNVNGGAMTVNGTTASLQYSGNITLVVSGQSLACTYTETSTVMKISNQ